ncbi:MAG: Dabb family protein [Verrucomicrobia bacterium]|nr:Dabb family protein [Verrucomicrobiota bacterium]
MFVHAVFFWLNKGISAADRKAFDAGLKSLLAIKTIRQGHVGKPAVTDRPVIDRTYDRGLTVVFETKSDHDAYQSDPIHLKFVKTCSVHWIRVLVYDFE